MALSRMYSVWITGTLSSTTDPVFVFYNKTKDESTRKSLAPLMLVALNVEVLFMTVLISLAWWLTAVCMNTGPSQTIRQVDLFHFQQYPLVIR